MGVRTGMKKKKAGVMSGHAGVSTMAGSDRREEMGASSGGHVATN